MHATAALEFFYLAYTASTRWNRTEAAVLRVSQLDSLNVIDKSSVTAQFALLLTSLAPRSTAPRYCDLVTASFQSLRRLL